MYTYQDWISEPEPMQLLPEMIRQYRMSAFFRRALEGSAYFRGSNTTVQSKTVLRACRIETADADGRRRVRSGTKDVVGNRIGSGFLHRFITQENQYLLGGGILTAPEIREKLGADFDHTLEMMGEMALQQGVCYGLWTGQALEMIPAASDRRSGCFLLRDEVTSAPMLGIRFWQTELSRQVYVRLYEKDGVTPCVLEGGHVTAGEKEFYGRRLYRTGHRLRDAGAVCFDSLPLIPLYGNPERQSELTDAIRSKIDAYDRILSDFADNLDRANDVYWVLNNFGGTMDEIAAMLEEINRIKAVASLSDGSGTSATAEPRTIEVPYAARSAALKLLEKALYRDYMALDMEEITSGSLTNVAIRVACANLDLKSARYEWEVRAFVRQLLSLLGAGDAAFTFRRQSIANETETVNNIVRMRTDIDRETALRLNPYLNGEDIRRLTEKREVQADA